MTTCCKCGRTLGKVRLYYQGRPIGPECGKLIGIIEQVPKRKRLSKPKKAKNPKFAAPEIERCPLTLDMFDYENEER